MGIKSPYLLLATALLAVPSKSRTLFPFEQTQLTREYVASLPAEDAELFAFGDQPEYQTRIAAVNSTGKRCRYGPSDGKWPSDKAWQKLAKQLSSPDALIKTTPQAAICYGTARDESKCQELTKGWSNSYTHIDDPTEILSPVYQGLTCQPPSIYDSRNCTLGGYPPYAVRPRTVLDIQLALNFARNDELRLVIKNTGHDFAGKSAGFGALSIWTHGLKDIQFFENYVDESGYAGPAIKAGAGVQAFELYKAAHEKGVMVVAGEGQTVGVMGGYIQGGGHSPLSSIHGMAADHVLGFEIVTSVGEFLSANSTSNPDLFWALRGGGGGTFGVVTSVIIKAYKDVPVSTASWSLDSSKVGKDRFWAATKAFVDHAIDYVDNGMYSYFNINPNGQEFSFIMRPMFAPNMTAKQTNALLSPYFSRLTSLNIPFSPKINEYKGFYAAWQAEFPLEPQSGVQTAFGSRLFPRSNFVSETGRNITFNVLRQTVEAGQNILAFNTAPTLAKGGNPDNAVNPAWRASVLHALAGHRWDIKASTAEIMSARSAFTNGTMQKWRDITPGSGAYVNEADRLEPNWQQSFWGDKYKRLLEIKKEWDPKDVFWAINSVGSEGWAVDSVDGLPNENGRLCKWRMGMKTACWLNLRVHETCC
ncbi:FAD-binding domain-containing protein [Corynespora cassiicola Philippines]|uniref:FAD-binding domain-containing protein n=1 Tax=Corynespora cassiicola Philippines TaxID=1448308 RepID=A0A2T2N9Y1_CORCC|nr:FAD-binding domain-containing protein [Corynespora cassiicola Philippines]